METVFISHASEDREFVEGELLPLFQRYKISAWYSKQDIPSAVAWEKTIRQGLKSCEWFLVVLTPDAIRSEWVQAEVHWAMEHRKERIVPVLIRGCDPTELHLQLIRFQYIDFMHEEERAREKLLSVWNITADESPRIRLRININPSPERSKPAENDVSESRKYYTVENSVLYRRSSLCAGEHDIEVNDFATIGRSPDCDLCLVSPYVSRKHAALRVKELGETKELWIFNLGTNGTFVNGKSISEQLVGPGDVIRIGQIEIAIIDISK